MSDIDDVICYLKSLRKGYDKVEFKDRITDLAYTVDTRGLEYDEFYRLFKIWLNLTIPVTKWVQIGLCLVPKESVREDAVEYTLKWLLENYKNQTSFSRICFVLDWLTAAMNSNSIDMEALDIGYEVFFMLLKFEILTQPVLKLVYTLTKPEDVTRRRVLLLLEMAKNRDGKKNSVKKLQVLLGLFKSYKPECVPESIAAFSIYTAFKKIHQLLVDRFSSSQRERNNINSVKLAMNWANPMASKINKKVEPLVPNLEFLNMGSKQYSNEDGKKTYLDFVDPSALVSFSLRHCMSRPARVRALLCNEVGLSLLATANDSLHAFLSHDLQHVLEQCFLQSSPYSYAEKEYLLRRLATFQNTLMQGLPVITRFLAQFLPFWNEKDYFFEILDLTEWISIDSPQNVSLVLVPLGRIFHRARPLEQCAILKCMITLFDNLAFASTRDRYCFMTSEKSEYYPQLLDSLANFISDTCNKSLQVKPDDLRSLHTALWCVERVCRSQLRLSTNVSMPPFLAMALPLLGVSAAALDKLAMIMLLYKKLVSKINKTSTNRKTEDQLWTLQAYTVDIVNCLWTGKIFAEKDSGIIFSKLNPVLVEKLKETVPNVDSALSLKSHIALAPYTYVQGEAYYKELDKKMWLDTVIDSECDYISRFLKKLLPELHA